MRTNKLMKKIIAILVIVCVLVSMVQISVVKAVESMIFAISGPDRTDIETYGVNENFRVGDSVVLHPSGMMAAGESWDISYDNTIISVIKTDTGTTVTALKPGTTIFKVYVVQHPDVYKQISITVSEATISRQIIGVYNMRNEQIYNIGQDGSFKVGDTIDVYNMRYQLPGDVVVVASTNTDIFEVRASSGEAGSDTIVAKAAGTANLQYYIQQDTSTVYEIPVTVSESTTTTGEDEITGDKSTTDDDTTTGDKTTTDDDKTTTGDKTTTDDDTTTTGDKSTIDDDTTKSTKKLPKTGATSFIALIVIAGAISVFTWYKSREIKY